MSNEDINTRGSHVISYNDSNFYSNTIGVAYLNEFDKTSTHTSDDLLTYCTTPNYKNTNSCGTSNYDNLKKNSNVKDISCGIIKQLCNNKIHFTNLEKIQKTHSASDSRYKDMESFYNTELLKTMNLGIGILILSAIIYKNT
jgi:hypothetical protein